ncbi:MAG: HAD family phosphatase [Eubacterium sp.]|nr:HAD family phosphatase [Eubacterium sp.]
MKAVIFDMDGVLFDTESLAIKAWDTIGEEVGLGKVGYMVFKTLGITREESVKIFEKEFGDKFNNDIFQAHYKAYLDEYYKNNPVPLKHGVIETLKYLKKNGYKTAVASSSSEDSVMHHLEDAGITHYFDAIICGDKVERSKPEPDIYLKAAESLGKRAEDCYAVEDSKNGLLSAHRAGCKVVYIPDLYKAEDEIKKIIDLKFETLFEFKEYIKSERI